LKNNREHKMDTNPVGNPQQVNALELKVNELLNVWKSENPVKKGFFNVLFNVKVSFNKLPLS